MMSLAAAAGVLLPLATAPTSLLDASCTPPDGCCTRLCLEQLLQDRQLSSSWCVKTRDAPATGNTQASVNLPWL